MKTTQLSTRVTPEDGAFLASLTIEGATTPSDKLRVLITEARRRRDELGDYQGSLRQIREMIAPATARLLEVEADGLPHSEVVTPVIEWMTEALAFALSNVPAEGASEDEARRTARSLEAGLTDRAFRLVQAMLKLGVTEEAPAYDPEVVTPHLEKALQVAKVLNLARTSGD